MNYKLLMFGLFISLENFHREMSLNVTANLLFIFVSTRLCLFKYTVKPARATTSIKRPPLFKRPHFHFPWSNILLRDQLS